MNYKGLLRKYLFHPAYVRIFVVVLLKLIKNQVVYLKMLQIA